MLLWNQLLNHFFVRQQDLQDESQRFDGDKYLASIKTAAKRDIVAADEVETLDE